MPCHKFLSMHMSYIILFAGGTPLRDDQMQQCTERAYKRHTEACRLIDDAYNSLSPKVDRWLFSYFVFMCVNNSVLYVIESFFSTKMICSVIFKINWCMITLQWITVNLYIKGILAYRPAPRTFQLALRGYSVASLPRALHAFRALENLWKKKVCLNRLKMLWNT